MKERSREMGSSPPTAEEIFRDYSALRTDAVHSLTNDHHDSPLSPHHCRRDHCGHITAVENTTIPSSCKRLGKENITIPVWLLFKLVHYQRMDHVRESSARQIPNLFFTSSRSCQRLGIQLLCPSPSDGSSITTVKGLELFGVKLSDASKKLGRKFATGASVVKNQQCKSRI